MDEYFSSSYRQDTFASDSLIFGIDTYNKKCILYNTDWLKIFILNTQF